MEIRVAGGAGRAVDLAESVSAQLRGLPGVKILGSLGERELVHLFQGALAVLVPSRDENFPYACAEALACGTPVIAARVGGIPELVSDGVEGILTDSGDIRGLADAVARLVADRDLCRQIGANARRRAERLLSSDRIAAQTVDFYREVIEWSRRRRPQGAREKGG